MASVHYIDQDIDDADSGSLNEMNHHLRCSAWLMTDPSLQYHDVNSSSGLDDSLGCRETHHLHAHP